MIKLLYSTEKTNSFRPTPWKITLSPFKAYRGDSHTYSAFLAVGSAYEFNPVETSGEGFLFDRSDYSFQNTILDTQFSKIIETKAKKTLLVVPCSENENERIVLLTLRGDFRGSYNHSPFDETKNKHGYYLYGCEILYSMSGSKHCCPTAHMVLRFTLPNGFFAIHNRGRRLDVYEKVSWEKGIELIETEEFKFWYHEVFSKETNELSLDKVPAITEVSSDFSQMWEENSRLVGRLEKAMKQLSPEDEKETESLLVKLKSSLSSLKKLMEEQNEERIKVNIC